MNLHELSGYLNRLAFHLAHAFSKISKGSKINAFGVGDGKIEEILIINLDRQPARLQNTLNELARFTTCDGLTLSSLAKRLEAIDARDGRAVAASSDVDQTYYMRHQLYVQPDARLEKCFGMDEPIRMTRQEVAVARSHIEAWKNIARGNHKHVLVIEDDIWFAQNAAALIDKGWVEASNRFSDRGGPNLLYFSYSDVGGPASRGEAWKNLFKPRRGLWFLSGYVLSRKGAQMLLEAMPVVGPVDMWINFKFAELEAIALLSPAILQRPDLHSDNQYSILPYLAKAGIVDSDAVAVPKRINNGPVFAWTSKQDRDGLAMALSMLGLRVRAFDGNEENVDLETLNAIFREFDAIVDTPMSRDTLNGIIEWPNAKFVLEAKAIIRNSQERIRLPESRTVILPSDAPRDRLWQPLCSLLGIPEPIQAFPLGPPRAWRAFRDDRTRNKELKVIQHSKSNSKLDDSAWALLTDLDWSQNPQKQLKVQCPKKCLVQETMRKKTELLPEGVDTFPGNLATFDQMGLKYDVEGGVQLVLTKINKGRKPYQSGTFASASYFGHGRFQAEIRAARGSGIITGFFLHRDSPRQEIDIEITGDNPRSMLVNVYFNPGDEGATMNFGYRGSPFRVELGFDATLDFHLYTIDWQPGYIGWSVDGLLVHHRVGWAPTPIPHLPMRLHANLWASRSEELAGKIDDKSLPAKTIFRNVSIWEC